MSGLKGLQALCSKAITESERKNIERLSEIKQLTKSLLKHYYEINDAQSYAKVVQTIISYIQHQKNNRPDILASLFDIKHSDMDVSRYFLEEGGNGLAWNILQKHDLKESKRTAKDIQPFLNNVANHLGIDNEKPLADITTLLSKLRESTQRQDLQKIHLYAEIFKLNIKQAFHHNEPLRVSQLIKGVLPLCEKALQFGQYELFISLFDLVKDDIEDLHACYENKAIELINWLLVDDLKLEKYAKEMPKEHQDVQAFKQAVLAGLGNATPLKTQTQLASELGSALARQDENALIRIKVEGWCNQVQRYLDNDIISYANNIEAIYEQIKLAYDNNDLTTISRFLDIGREDLDELIVLIESQDKNAILYFLIQNEDIEEEAFTHSTYQDGSDAAHAIEFRKALYAHFATPHELTANLEQMNELIASTLQNPTTEALNYAEIKISQALQNAFQKNDVEGYLAFLQKAIEIYSMLMENDASTLMLSLKLPKTKREAFLYYLQEDKPNICVAILLEDDMNFHKGFKYASHQHLLDFKERAFEKLGIDKIPDIDIKMETENEAHHENPNFIQYWSSKITRLGSAFIAKETIEFKEQMKLKLQHYFKENDVQGYSEVINLLRVYRDECVNQHNLAGLSLVLAIDHDDVNTTLKLMNSDNRPYIEWRTIQQHELDEVCERQGVKYAEIAPFLSKVYQNIQIKPEKCFRERSAIIADSKLAIDEDRLDDIEYYITELRGLLKQAIYANDSISAAKTVDALVELAHYASERERLDITCNILKLSEVNIETINQCFIENKIDLLKVAYINDISLENTFRHNGDYHVSAKLKSEIQNNLNHQKPQLFSSINKLEQLITDALQDQNELALKTLSFECDMIIRHAFLHNNQSLFAEMNRFYARIIQKGVELRHNDLVIRHFDIDSEYVDLIQLIQNYPGLSFDHATFNKLELYTIIQSQKLEYLGAIYGIENKDIQQFKRRAHEELLHEPEKLLLCELSWILVHGQDLINQPHVARLDRLLWQAHAESHLEFAYENANPQRFADIISMINSLLHQSFDTGNYHLLLDCIDFKPKERDALFHHLQHRNSTGTAQVLTEVLIRNNSNNFKEKFGYHYYPDFRINVYEHLKIPPAEISFVSETKDYPGIRLIHSDEAAFENLSWIRNKGINIDIRDTFTQNVLLFLAKHDLGDSAITFLKILKKPNTLQAAQLLKAFRLEQQLSHRIGLTGERVIEGATIQVENGFEADMLRQLQDMQSVFYANKTILDDYLLELYQQPIDGSKLVEEISKDLNSVSVRNNAKTVASTQSANRLVNIPVSLRVVDNPKFTGHAVNCCYFDDFCLLADRSRAGNDLRSGIRICKITKPENKDRITDEIGGSHYDELAVNDKQYEDYMTENLGLVDVGFIPMTPQTAGNCTWSSCAEMMHLSSVYAKLYQQGLDLKLNEQESMEKAIEGAIHIHETFITRCLTNDVLKYIAFLKTTTLQINPISLAMVYLRCEHHPLQQPIAELITNANILNERNLSDAYEQLLNDAKELIPLEVRQNADPNQITLQAKTLLDLFLEYNLEGAEDYYQTISHLNKENIAASSQPIKTPEKRAKSLSFQRPTISSRESLESSASEENKAIKPRNRSRSN